MEQQLEQAVRTYLARQDRTEHPKGHFDKAGRWYPDEVEERPCCRNVRCPSRSYPYSYMTHCRSIEHIASLYGVDVKALRKAVRQARPARREGGEDYYKAVAVVDGELRSIFDGTTVYRIGEELREAAHQQHGGGYYVYPTPDAARSAALPKDAALLDAPRAIIRVRAAGTYCTYDNGKLAFSRITPLEVLAA